MLPLQTVCKVIIVGKVHVARTENFDHFLDDELIRGRAVKGIGDGTQRFGHTGSKIGQPLLHPFKRGIGAVIRFGDLRLALWDLFFKGKRFTRSKFRLP